MVLGASNLWFNSSISVLSLPVGGGSLNQLVYDNWATLDKMPVKEVLTYALAPDSKERELRGAFAGHDLDEIWAAIEARRAGGPPAAGADVRGPEWVALTTGSQGQTSPHFEAEPIAAPTALDRTLAGVTLAHRLRVVTALCGFTRLSAGEPGDGRATVRLETKGSPTWVPVVENRGERIYSRGPGEGPEPMAGILLYTSAPDAEGTLGGLVNLGMPSELGPILRRALERAGLCSSDPLCADHEPDAATSAVHGAACHACLLVAETSCERGNRYLDRSLLADTFGHTGLEYFE